MTMDDTTLARARAAIDALAAVEAEATAGPWRKPHRGWVFQGEGKVPAIAEVYREPDADAVAIAVLRNAAPALLALARACADMDPSIFREHLPRRLEAPGRWEAGYRCRACGSQTLHLIWDNRRTKPTGVATRTYHEPHAPDCPALAIDAALAALVGDAPGEVSG
ncbi:MAG: hypothetical protein ABI780_01805 [Ardenticatenales bacterium]